MDSKEKGKFNKGGAAGIEGGMFQINLLTLFLLNGLLKHENWRMSTENKGAGKFDDLVFEFGPPNNLESILLQAKHKKNKKKKISYNDLLSTNSKSDEFSLPKYFFSFEEIKNNFKVQNIFICTNTDLKLDEKLKHLIRKEFINKDSILYFQKADSFCYTFNENIIPEIEDKILEYYDENLQGKNIDKTIICKENIKDFLKHLQFVANYPSKRELDEIMEKAISKLNISENLDSKDASKYILKKMVDWFKEEQGRYLTQKDAKSFFCEIRSNKYCETLQKKIYFRNNTPVFSASKKILHLVCEKEYLLNLIKIYQILPTETLYVNPDEDLNTQKQIIEAFEIPAYSTLLIISLKKTSENNLKEIYDKITGILKNSSHKKFILVAKEKDKFANLFKVNEDIYEKIHEKILFSDLSEDSQNRLLNERFIYFQKKKVSLEELLTVTSQEELNETLGNEVLTKLVKNDTSIHIGTDVSFLDENTEKFYIERNFNCKYGQRLSEEDICQLVKDNKDKIILISDAPGTGKSTVLTSLAMKMKNKFHHLWVIRINLNSYTKILNDYVRKKIKAISIKDLLNSQDFSKFKSDFEEKLFMLRHKIILMLDGVDEISPNYTDLIMSLITISLKSENIKKILVTTRSNIQDTLESTFNVKSLILQEFSIIDQINFLKNYWMWHLNLQEDDEEKCAIYASNLVEKVQFWSINAKGKSRDKDFTALPQQIKMLAEIFEDDSQLLKVEWEGCKKFINSSAEDVIFPKKLNLGQLYEILIEKKQNIYIYDKGNVGGNLIAIEALENELTLLQSYHYKLAFEVLFTEDNIFKQFKLYTSSLSDTVPEKSLVKLGIIQKMDDKLSFIHRTFAEYFVSEFLIKELINSDDNQQFHDFFICELLINSEYNMIRNFLDYRLKTVIDLQQLPKKFLNINPDISVSSKIIHTLAAEGCIELLKFVFHCYNFDIPINIKDDNDDSPLCIAADRGYLEVVKFLVEHGAALDITGYNGCSALFNAVFRNEFELVKYLIEKGADYNIVNESGDTVLHASTTQIDILTFFVNKGMNINATNEDGQTALLTAAYKNQLEVVKFLVERGADIRISDIDGRTALHHAVYGNHIDIIKYLIGKGADFRSRDSFGKTILHRAAEGGYLDSVEYLIQDVGMNFEEVDIFGKTPLHCAIYAGYMKVIKYLLENVVDKNGKTVNINAKDNDGCTPLHYACSYTILDIANYLVNQGADINITNNKGIKALYKPL